MRENILVRQNGEIKVRMWKVPIPEETRDKEVMRSDPIATY